MPGNVEGGASVGPAIAGFGAAPIDDRGLVGPNFRLEDYMTIAQTRDKVGYKPIGEINFNPSVEEAVSEPTTLTDFSLVDEAVKIVDQVLEPTPVTAVIEHPLNKVKNIWEELRNQEDLTPDITHRAFLAAAAVNKSPQFYGWPQADPEYTSDVLQDQKTQSLPSTNMGSFFRIPHGQESKTAQAIYIKKAEQKKDTHLERSNEEDIEIRRKRFVVDEAALAVVTTEIRAAVRKAGSLAKELGIKITGPLINRFLPGQNPGNESEAVRGKGPDGSIPERAEVIKKSGEFTTTEEAESSSIEVANEIPPIKVRNEGEGEPVKDENVYTVYKDYPVKPNLSEVDVSEQLTATKVEIITESRIEDYPDLAEVFKPQISPNI